MVIFFRTTFGALFRYWGHCWATQRPGDCDHSASPDHYLCHIFNFCHLFWCLDRVSGRISSIVSSNWAGVPATSYLCTEALPVRRRVKDCEWGPACLCICAESDSKGPRNPNIFGPIGPQNLTELVFMKGTFQSCFTVPEIVVPLPMVVRSTLHA